MTVEFVNLRNTTLFTSGCIDSFGMREGGEAGGGDAGGGEAGGGEALRAQNNGG